MVRCRQLGIAVYLIKPVKPAELQQALLRAIGQEGQTPSKPVAPARAPHDQRPLRILLAEDNTVNQKLAVCLLQRWGHDVAVASNGKEALARMELESFDVVLMDVQMPELDGLEATRMIRAREAALNAECSMQEAESLARPSPSSLVTPRSSPSRIPIIAMTAHAMKGDKERCLTAGMDDYVSKPLKPGELQAALARVAFRSPLTEE
jgi:two-component system sensor histidine kinase/response regulator